MTDAEDRSASHLPRVTERVQEFYTQYPFPPVSAVTGDPPLADLHYVRHVLWPDRPRIDGLRILDAGCGTGATAVRLARDFPSVEVTGLDLSPTALDQARVRAEQEGVRGNLAFIQGTLEEFDAQEHYDFIVSSGVIHHLADPVAGLSRLSALLRPTGGIGFMVYAPYGRRPVQLVREILKQIPSESESPVDQAKHARAIVKALTPSHPFAPDEWTEMGWGSDAGIADLLMHVHERTYSVPELLTLLDASGLRLERFYGPEAYRPEHYLTDEAVADPLRRLDQEQAAVLAELLHGRMTHHWVFTTLRGRRPLRFPLHASLVRHMRPRRMARYPWNAVLAVSDDEETAFVLPDWAVPGRTTELPGWARAFFRAATGTRTVLQIFHDGPFRQTIDEASTTEKLATYLSFVERAAQEEMIVFES